ncbi:MAG: hypothetical protein H0V17_11435 [Deltaproteobacteria bacterium]|nr:hypothetical protein [Deltaproteobacteria bacterium]
MDDDRRTRLRTTLLRGLIVGLIALCVIAAVFAFIPSVEVYEDRNDCLGHALGGVFAHGPRSPCQSAYQLVRTDAPIDGAVAVLYLVGLLVPGVLLWFHPLLRYALLWPVWTIVATVVLLTATFELDLFSHTVRLWPAHVFAIAMTAILAILIVVVPLGSGVFALVTRSKAPGLPRAVIARR